MMTMLGCLGPREGLTREDRLSRPHRTPRRVAPRGDENEAKAFTPDVVRAIGNDPWAQHVVVVCIHAARLCEFSKGFRYLSGR
jgi:hypothetical protein